MNATTNNVITPHTVTVILSNFDGDVDKTIALLVKQIAPKYTRQSNAIINHISYIVLGLAVLL